MKNFYSTITGNVNTIFGVAELGNSECSKLNTEPDPQNVKNIEDKHAPSLGTLLLTDLIETEMAVELNLLKTKMFLHCIYNPLKSIYPNFCKDFKKYRIFFH